MLSPNPPPSIVIAGTPRLIATLASVLWLPSADDTFSAFDAASAVRMIGAVSDVRPAGRIPIVSILSVNGAFDLGQRARSSTSARVNASRSFASMAASDAADSLRRSISITPRSAIELTEVPPDTTPTLKVTFGDAVACRSAIFAIARPIA